RADRDYSGWSRRAETSPNPAARWPYLAGPATAVDEYEDAPHDEDDATPGDRRLSAVLSTFREHWTPGARAGPTARTAAEQGRAICQTPRHERTPRTPSRGLCRVRGLAPARLRLVLPQRDRATAGRARGHPHRHAGRVRHRHRR